MSDQPTWLKVALGAGVGFLCGIVLIVALALGGGDGGDGAQPRTDRERPATVARPTVPGVVGLRLDVARERLETAGYAVEHRGGGLLGVVVEGNWEVRAQEPAAETPLARGGTVELFVERP